MRWCCRGPLGRAGRTRSCRAHLECVIGVRERTADSHSLPCVRSHTLSGGTRGHEPTPKLQITSQISAQCSSSSGLRGAARTVRAAGGIMNCLQLSLCRLMSGRVVCWLLLLLLLSPHALNSVCVQTHRAAAASLCRPTAPPCAAGEGASSSGVLAVPHSSPAWLAHRRACIMLLLRACAGGRGQSGGRRVHRPRVLPDPGLPRPYP
jgi:hypothetical protein